MLSTLNVGGKGHFLPAFWYAGSLTICHMHIYVFTAFKRFLGLHSSEWIRQEIPCLVFALILNKILTKYLSFNNMYLAV